MWRHIRMQSKWHNDQFSCQCQSCSAVNCLSQLTTECPYTLPWVPLSPKIAPSQRWPWSWSWCTGSRPQVTMSHPSVVRLPLLSARPAVTSPAAEHHCPLAGTKLYCLVTETHRCKQLAQGCYAALPRVGFAPATYWLQSPTLYPLHYRSINPTVN